MRQRIFGLIAATSVAAALATNFAAAQTRPGGGIGGRGGAGGRGGQYNAEPRRPGAMHGGYMHGERGLTAHKQRWLDQLNLTEAQRSQVNALAEKKKAQVASLRTSLESQIQTLKQKWSAAEPKRSEIDAVMAQIDALHSQLRAKRLDFEFAVYNLLTPEQKARFRELMANKHAHMAGPAPVDSDE